MKRVLKFGITALLLAFAVTALSGLGSIKASAGTLSADLDGDGKEESIAWESDDLSSLSINGKAVFKTAKVKLPKNDYYDFDIRIMDTATKDNYKEVVVCRSLEELSQYYFFRYDNGKISKYAFFDYGEEIVSQKTKNRIKIRSYVFVKGIGNIRVDEVFKIKKGKATLLTKEYKPNKLNEATTFKANAEPIIFTDTTWTTEAGTLKNGEKFTLVKFTADENGDFSQLYIKTKSGVKGWINTTDYDSSTFLVKNPPLWN